MSLRTTFAPFPRRLRWLLLALIGLLLVGCSGATQAHWPGLTAVGERVYVAHGTGVVAVDMDARQQVWRYTGEGTVQFYAPPAVEDGRIIIGDYGSSGGLFSSGLTVSIYALDEVASGNPTVSWVKDDIVSGRVFAQPLYVGDLVIVGTSDNQIVALNADDGSKVWAFQTGNAIWGQPAHKDDLIFVTSVDRHIYALNHDTGELVWDKTLSGANASSPVVNGDLVYVGSFDKKLHAYEMATGTEVWTATAEDWIWGAPLYTAETVYYTDLQGNVYAVEADTGEPIWAQKVTGSVQAAPVLVDGVLYIASTDPSSVEIPQGYLTAFNAADGSPAWDAEVQVEAPIHATPVVVGDSLVVAVILNDTNIFEIIQYNLQTGAKIWSFTPPTE